MTKEQRKPRVFVFDQQDWDRASLRKAAGARKTAMERFNEIFNFQKQQQHAHTSCTRPIFWRGQITNERTSLVVTNAVTSARYIHSVFLAVAMS